MDEQLETGANPYRSSHAGIVPTDVTTKLYHQRKTGKGSVTSNVMCQMCGKSTESVRYVLAGCG